MLRPDDIPGVGIFERAFEAAGSHANPYTDVSATASFVPPGGQVLTIPLLRRRGGLAGAVLTDTVGVWTWSVSSADAGPDGATGGFTVVSSGLRGGVRARADPQDWGYLLEAIPGTVPAAGDFDRDGDVDQQDFSCLQACYTTVPPEPPRAAPGRRP